MDEIEHRVYTTNGILHSFVMLVQCLERSGSLPAGRFQAALRETFNHPDADFERPDYHFFADLLRELERAADKGSGE